ncbi:LysR family transcriptional regulator [Elstera cyanobacteriorum]|uniref:LysR family transcriptional regulator n=1 Tax=Elstera cyanobacteriorum TaxID=2022747 RepID=A0A255XJX7_9PROT|nr:LysR family transcriptional regulator [Elstera cyanobacteriorum]OYQ17277.1 LysR family transcriptional regulator [Elstera cyanobacteriorum]GFZ92740.1 LysR family transcriptional regulator [Elstera cyanobacteriorum]
MPRPDLDQLITLDVLLSAGSVARAAERLQLSPSAMSRALARLRASFNDPLLVRAGRGLVPTPRAEALRPEVRRVLEAAEALFRIGADFDPAHLSRTFTLRISDGFLETFGPPLLATLAREAPGVRLRFVPKQDKDSAPLRDGSIDLETGVIGPAMGPEVRAQALFRDRFIGVVRPEHPLAGGRVTAEDYAAGQHIAVARRPVERWPADEALAALGLTRQVRTIVGGFAAALFLVRSGDLIATVPEQHTAGLRAGLIAFPLPIAVPEITVSLFWHPRFDADPAHRWLRETLRAICKA